MHIPMDSRHGSGSSTDTFIKNLTKPTRYEASEYVYRKS